MYLDIQFEFSDQQLDFVFQEEDNLDLTISDFVQARTQIDYYTGEYQITPSANKQQILSTADKMMREDLTIKKVPYYITSNANGVTAYIASEVE